MGPCSLSPDLVLGRGFCHIPAARPQGGAFSAPKSSSKPELGHPGEERGRAGGREQLTQSTMRILLSFPFCCSCLAAMATELKKQNPLRRGSWSTPRAPRAPFPPSTNGWAVPPLSLDTAGSRGSSSGAAISHRACPSSKGTGILGPPKPPAPREGTLTLQWMDPRDVRAASPQRNRSGDKNTRRSSPLPPAPHPARRSSSRGTRGLGEPPQPSV